MTHRLEVAPDSVHWGFLDGSLEPTLRVTPGKTVQVETFSYPKGEDLPEPPTPRLRRILPQLEHVGPGPKLLTGPIYVEGAMPGDVLAIHIDSVFPLVPFAYNRILSGRGLLPEDFPGSAVRLLELDIERRLVRFADKIEIPMRVFFGVMAVAPSVDGRVSSSAPGSYGGNMDISELTAGSTLYLPVFRPGALVSVGDGHSVQGDGEVDVSAAETSLIGELRFELRRDLSLEMPMIETRSSWITTGFHEDLL